MRRLWLLLSLNAHLYKTDVDGYSTSCCMYPPRSLFLQPTFGHVWFHLGSTSTLLIFVVLQFCQTSRSAFPMAAMCAKTSASRETLRSVHSRSSLKLWVFVVLMYFITWTILFGLFESPVPPASLVSAKPPMWRLAAVNQIHKCQSARQTQIAVDLCARGACPFLLEHVTFRAPKLG